MKNILQKATPSIPCHLLLSLSIYWKMMIEDDDLPYNQQI